MLQVDQPIHIYLLRHGEYTDLGSEIVEKDKLNRLSDEGIAKLQREAAAWRHGNSRLISSSADLLYAHDKQQTSLARRFVGQCMDMQR